MPYLGNNLATQFQAFTTQTITGDGSTGYTLDKAVANGKELLVYINNVKQEEGSGKAYTATGTTITFSEAVASTDTCYVVYLGSAVQTVNPPDASVGSSQLASSIDFQNITIKGGSTTALTVDSSGRLLTPARPAFMARRTSLQSAGVIIFDTAMVNIGSHYNTSTGVFTAPVAGLYSFSPVILSDMDGTNQFFVTQLLVNGSSYAQEQVHTDLDNDFGASFTVIASLSASDEVKVSTNYKIYGTSSATANFTFWSGYLLG